MRCVRRQVMFCFDLFAVKKKTKTKTKTILDSPPEATEATDEGSPLALNPLFLSLNGMIIWSRVRRMRGFPTVLPVSSGALKWPFGTDSSCAFWHQCAERQLLAVVAVASLIERERGSERASRRAGRRDTSSLSPSKQRSDVSYSFRQRRAKRWKRGP